MVGRNQNLREILGNSWESTLEEKEARIAKNGVDINHYNSPFLIYFLVANPKLGTIKNLV